MARSTVSSTQVGKYLVWAYYATIPSFLLPITNPYAKANLACFIGLSSITAVLYATSIYFKSLLALPIDRTRTGLIVACLNFVPNTIERVSQITANVLSRLLQACGLISNFQINPTLLAYALLCFRKLLALASWMFITPNDDNPTHSKMFLGYLFINLVEYRFIINSDSATHSTPSRVTTVDALRSFWSPRGKNMKIEAEKMQSRRRIVFYFALVCSTLLLSAFLQSYRGAEDYTTANAVLTKLLLVAEIEFRKTQCLEFGGLNLSLKDSPDIYRLV